MKRRLIFGKRGPFFFDKGVNEMKKLITLGTLFFLVIPAYIAMSAGAPPAPGSQLPDIQITFPPEQSDKSYLGLAGSSSTFRVPEVKGRVVIVEILSMYCPFCQKEAPVVNKLYGAIEKDPTLKGKIKILGIGVGNTVYEVELFRKKYAIPFPISPDPDSLIHKQVGEVRTPYFIAVKINDNGSHEVIYSKLGSFGEVDPFLDILRKASELQ
jgi:thiol-disulfide isomerase/thioredoxin